MKWYFCINEAGTAGDVGLHAKIAVISAARFTRLRPHLLYVGSRNDFTFWMERHGVKVIDYLPSFADLIYDLNARGRYSTTFLGHWLRTGICRIERDDDFTLYTDCDVVFAADPEPYVGMTTTFSCGPEFLITNWNYFNSGVMLMNIAFLDRTYDDFETFIRGALPEFGSRIRDQYCYNTFYRRHWERLAPALNWKPYWGMNPHALIVHFHGAKLGAIMAILDNRWDWSDEAGMQIGSLFAGHVPYYAQSLEAIINIIGGELPQETELLGSALSKIERYRPSTKIDLGFMNFRMFGD